MADIAFKQLLLKNRVKGQYLQLLYFYSKMILIITLYKIHFNFFFNFKWHANKLYPAIQVSGVHSIVSQSQYYNNK